MLDDLLRERLRAAGVDPDAPGDARTAWLRLQEHFGRRATLLDRYALEADARGIAVESLPAEMRAALGQDVLEVQYPGFGLASGSERTTRDPIEVVPYREDWPALFASWRDRLAGALGPAAVRIEHIGSTSVPGLAAKPVIDVQVSVPDAEDEPAYVAPIESVGVVLRARDAGHRYFRPAGTASRVAQIHVCSAGSTWERDHLLFRDYLRADAAARDAYAELKLELAQRWRNDRLAYNEGKSNLIFDLLAEAEVWADSTAWTVGGTT